jgi:hypothetical protein
MVPSEAIGEKADQSVVNNFKIASGDCLYFGGLVKLKYWPQLKLHWQTRITRYLNRHAVKS